MTKIAEISADSTDASDYETSTSERSVKNFAKEMLRTQLFVGTFQELRYVEPLQSYRDVVKIDDGERKFIENLMAVKRKIESVFAKKWVGITKPETIGAPVGYNVWVTLPEKMFGKYWYVVKKVEFLEREIRLRLAVVRPYEEKKSREDSPDVEDFNPEYFKDLFCIVKSSIKYFFTIIFSLENIKQTVIFISLLLATLLTGLANLIKYLMEYLLKFMKELSSIIKAITPIITTTVNVIGKVIYGCFHSFMALFYKKQIVTPYMVDPRMYRPVYPRIQQNYVRQRGLPYNDGGVTIEEVYD